MEVAAEQTLSQRPERRQPELRDHWYFFAGIPASIAFIFSLVGVRLIAGMPYIDGLLYTTLHMLLAWSCVSAGAWSLKILFRSWRPPVSALCVMGFVATIIPAAFLFQMLGDFYAGLYPVFAQNRADTALPAWTIDYIFHFIRYSIPALPLFMAGVYGYRYVTGVDWLGYPEQPEPAERAPAVAADSATVAATETRAEAPLAGGIDGTRLPADAEIIAIKAEQHYIRIWSDQGVDLVRYRFRDLDTTFAHCTGSQVHRSWWVNFAQVSSYRKSGRSLDLRLSNDMIVPVSLAYRNAVLREVDERINAL